MNIYKMSYYKAMNINSLSHILDGSQNHNIEQRKEVIVKLFHLGEFQNQVKLNNILFRDTYGKDYKEKQENC